MLALILALARILKTTKRARDKRGGEGTTPVTRKPNRQSCQKHLGLTMVEADQKTTGTMRGT